MRGIEQIVAMNRAATKAYDDARERGLTQVYEVRDAVTRNKLFVFDSLQDVAKFDDSFKSGALTLHVINL